MWGLHNYMIVSIRNISKQKVYSKAKKNSKILEEKTTFRFHWKSSARLWPLVITCPRTGLMGDILWWRHVACPVVDYLKYSLSSGLSTVEESVVGHWKDANHPPPPPPPEQMSIVGTNQGRSSDTGKLYLTQSARGRGVLSLLVSKSLKIA
jgi:hypothetical protein